MTVQPDNHRYPVSKHHINDICGLNKFIQNRRQINLVAFNVVMPLLSVFLRDSIPGDAVAQTIDVITFFGESR